MAANSCAFWLNRGMGLACCAPSKPHQSVQPPTPRKAPKTPGARTQVEQEKLEYLARTSSKQFVTLQWVQRLVVENSRTGVIDIQAPILSRVFQEFSIGIVHFVDAQKLSTVPFPFPFAQALWALLAIFSLFVIPFICASGMGMYRASAYTFVIVFVFWAVHHISVEIELPFGDDPNDLPLVTMNRRFNKRLERLCACRCPE